MAIGKSSGEAARRQLRALFTECATEAQGAKIPIFFPGNST